MELIWTPTQVIDIQGKKTVGVMMAYTPIYEDVIDTSSPTLTAPFICYDNCKGVGYVRQLGTGNVTIVRAETTMVMSEVATMAKKYAEREVNA